jgi:hypothetical protein
MQPIRHVDFDTGDFSQIPPGDVHGEDPSSVPTIVTNRVHGGTYAARCRLDNPNLYIASEIRMWGWSPETLPPIYYSFWIYVEDGYDVGNGGENWQMICEWNAPYPVGGGKHVDISFQDAHGVKNNLYMNFFQIHLLWGVPGASPAYPNAMIWSDVEMPTGKWVFFEIYYVTDMTNGIIQAKMNGKVILEWKGRTQFDPENGNTAIAWCPANYCGHAVPPHSFWFDDIWIDYVSHA